MQDKAVYESTLSKFALNWNNINGEIKLVDQPYSRLSNNNFVNWDAKHYYQIKQNGYDVKSAGGDYIYAFFPLFPLIWKLTALPPVAILVLNYFFYTLGVWLLLKIFSAENNMLVNTILSFSIPGLVIFLIPYSEAIFFLTISVGVFGFIKKKYWIYFVGLMLAAIARPSYTILGLAIFFTEIFFLIDKVYYKQFVKNLLLRVLPLIAGTIVVALFQLSQGSEDFFKFIKVQAYWENILSIPHNLRDWSHEGFAINVGILIMVFIPIIILLFQKTVQRFRKLIKNSSNFDDIKYYIQIISMFYVIGSTLFILFFRGGSLNCLFRFTICTPLFLITVYALPKYINNIATSVKSFFFLSFTLIAVLVLGLTDYSTFWNFSDLGLFILCSSVGLWIYSEYQKQPFYKVILYSTLIINLVWTTYLFNMYLNNAWIFA